MKNYLIHIHNFSHFRFPNTNMCGQLRMSSTILTTIYIPTHWLYISGTETMCSKHNEASCRCYWKICGPPVGRSFHGAVNAWYFENMFHNTTPKIHHLLRFWVSLWSKSLIFILLCLRCAAHIIERCCVSNDEIPIDRRNLIIKMDITHNWFSRK